MVTFIAQYVASQIYIGKNTRLTANESRILLFTYLQTSYPILSYKQILDTEVATDTLQCVSSSTK